MNEYADCLANLFDGSPYVQFSSDRERIRKGIQLYCTNQERKFKQRV